MQSVHFTCDIILLTFEITFSAPPSSPRHNRLPPARLPSLPSPPDDLNLPSPFHTLQDIILVPAKLYSDGIQEQVSRRRHYTTPDEVLC